MKLIHLTFATAAVALLGGAAYAQQPTEPADNAPAPASSTTQSAPPADQPTVSATSTTETPAAPAATSAGANVSATSFTNMTVTNGPVPDTPQNRAKYGQPLSHAGKRTAARGN